VLLPLDEPSCVHTCAFQQRIFSPSIEEIVESDTGSLKISKIVNNNNNAPWDNSVVEVFQTLPYRFIPIAINMQKCHFLRNIVLSNATGHAFVKIALADVE